MRPYAQNTPRGCRRAIVGARVSAHPSLRWKAEAVRFRALAEPGAETATPPVPVGDDDKAVSEAVAGEDASDVGTPEAMVDAADVAGDDSSFEAPSADVWQLAGANASESSTAQQEKSEPVGVNFKLGDTVIGTVLWANERGARVQIEGCEEYSGFMPTNRGPHAIRSATEVNPFSTGGFGPEGCVPKGLKRPFKVIAIPPDMDKQGKGPLLACNNMDFGVLWKRLQQMHKLCQSGGETVRVYAHAAADRGLMVTLAGVRGWLPVGHIIKDGGEWLDKNDLESKYVGKELEVSLLSLDRSARTFTCSETNAARDRALRALHIGCLVWGTVTRIESYGAFLQIDGTPESGLLHITHISHERVPSAEQFFEEGERVRAIVTGMEANFTRISVSTRELEVEPGDMIYDRESVYSNADETAAQAVQRWTVSGE